MRPTTRLQRAADLWLNGLVGFIVVGVAAMVLVAGAEAGAAFGNHPVVGLILAVLIEITFIASLIDGRII
jgi:hypothetical protein